jgi:hypothetical protein
VLTKSESGVAYYRDNKRKCNGPNNGGKKNTEPSLKVSVLFWGVD